MKNKTLCLLIIILSAINNIAQAQTETDIAANGRTFSQIFDSLSTGLIPSRIPYGILYDRVYPWSGLSQWTNGDTTSVAHLFQSWFDAEQSVVNPLARPTNYAVMRSEVQQQLFDVKLPVVALNFQFAYIDSMALQDGRLSHINGILTDNQQASPYLTKQVAIAGIVTDKIYANKNYVLQFGSPLILNNTSASIQSIVVNNITVGTQYTLAAGAGQLMQFTHAGSNVLSFTVNLSGGGSYIAYQVINAEDINTGIGGSGQRVLSPTGPNCVPTNDLVESAIPFQGYGETQATNSFADYHIYYHTQSPTATDCERVLRKPIIILDGFDPRDKREYSKLYNSYLKNNENGALLGDDLRDKGYDLIILNFPVLGSSIEGPSGVSSLGIPVNVKVNGTSQTINAKDRDGGADYIERNAFLLVKLIQQVNATLAANGSTEKIVVVGPSMGGQISRYALAYMEKKQAEGVSGMDHNTRLWVSFDSPHDGANIPLAFQETLRFFGNEGQKKESKDAYETQLRSSAARQLLIEQLDGQNSTATYHQTYYNNLRSNGLPGSEGYPQNLRKINLVNGAGNGLQTYGPGTEVLNGEGRATFLNLKVFELIDNFMPNPGVSMRIMKARIAVKSFLSITFPAKSFTITNNNPRGSMDAVPGSTINTARDLYEEFEAALKKEKVRTSWSSRLPYHCFIPSMSALGFRNPNFNWDTRVDNRNLVCTNEIYFDNYYIPTFNQDHIYLNTDNVNWLLQEIDAIQNCISICSILSISGNSSLCTTTSGNYTINNLPNGATVHWETDPAGIATPNTPDQTQTTLTMNGAGSIILKATITNACNISAPVTKQINVGSPFIQATVNGPDNAIANAGYYFSLSTNPWGAAISNINWRVPSGWSITTGQGTMGNVTIWTGTQTGAVEVDFDDACGVTRSVFKTVEIGSGGDIQPLNVGAAGVIVFPNPASDIISVSLSDLTTKVNSTFIKQIKITNKMGLVVQSLTYNDKLKSRQVNIAMLKPDIYTVQVYDNKTWHSVKVIKQ